jgi:hypothetical protein
MLQFRAAVGEEVALRVVSCDDMWLPMATWERDSAAGPGAQSDGRWKTHLSPHPDPEQRGCWVATLLLEKVTAQDADRYYVDFCSAAGSVRYGTELKVVHVLSSNPALAGATGLALCLLVSACVGVMLWRCPRLRRGCCSGRNDWWRPGEVLPLRNVPGGEKGEDRYRLPEAVLVRGKHLKKKKKKTSLPRRLRSAIN